MFDLTTVEGVKAFMSMSSSEEDWDGRCEVVTEHNEGSYPGCWYNDIMASGFAAKVRERWESGKPPMSPNAPEGNPLDIGAYEPHRAYLIANYM